MQPFNYYEHGIVLPKLTRKTTEKGRKYFTPDDKSYPSITTVLSILSKQAIMEWRLKVGPEEANKISRQASTRGTAVHKIAEDYINNDVDYAKKHMPANVYSFNQIKPIIDKRVNNVYFQEAFLYSDILKTAGQVDLISEWVCDDGVTRLAIIDFKTSKRPKEIEWITSYFIQTFFYAAAFLERTGIAIKKGVILIAVDGSEPQVFEFDLHEYLPHFLSVREKYRELYEK